MVLERDGLDVHEVIAGAGGHGSGLGYGATRVDDGSLDLVGTRPAVEAPDGGNLRRRDWDSRYFNSSEPAGPLPRASSSTAAAAELTSRDVLGDVAVKATRRKLEGTGEVTLAVISEPAPALIATAAFWLSLSTSMATFRGLAAAPSRTRLAEFNRVPGRPC
ncbi:MAG: hypothetical protein JNK87_41450 [Bryobacterales bacterium]|nr:hypothetical protein [Bryobacterales bacterium]